MKTSIGQRFVVHCLAGTRRSVAPVLVLLAIAAPVVVLSYNGGSTKGTAVALPITPPDSFVGDNTGLTSSPAAGQRWNNVTWWTWTPSATATYAVRASSISPGGWDNTLEIWSGSGAGTLVTQNDDFYGLDAQVTFTANAGTTYVIGLGGYSSGSRGTATVRFFEAPTAPQSVTATAGDTTAAVSWAMPDANILSVSSYRIYRYIAGVQDGSPTTVSGTPPATSRTVSGLLNGTQYTFRVSAVNSVGEGPLSAATSAVTPTAPVTAPGAPTGVAALAGDTTASVGFTPPASNGGAAITSYTVTASPGGQTATSSTSPIVVSGLVNGTSYTFSVVATNSVGSGSASVASAPVVPAASQTVLFGALAGRMLDDPAFMVNATGGGSGNPVTFSSGTPSVCVVAAGTVTLVAAGTCSLAADQAGAAGFRAAATVVQSFAVAPACTLALAEGLLSPAQVGVPYASRLTATGGSGAEAYALTSGTLPGLSLAGDGTIAGTPTEQASTPVSVRVTEGACSANALYTLNVGPARWITNGPGAGGTTHVRSFDMTPAQARGPIGSFLAEPPAFGGGVRVALGDVNGDGIADVITGAGPGGTPTVRVFNGADGTLLRTVMAFEAGFGGGVFVAAGDVNDDGLADVVVGSGEGRSPSVRIFDGRSGAALPAPMGEFSPYVAGFVGGVHVAAGDINGDGRADVITGAGPGGGPHVRVWDGVSRGEAQELAGFFAYDPAFTGGVYVAAGDVDGDGYADVITGAGAGGGPHVRVWDVSRGGGLLQSFFAYDPAFVGGVRVAAADLDADGRAEIVTGAGPGGGPHVRVWTSGTGALRELTGFFAYDAAFAAGVYVAAPSPARRMAVDAVTQDPAMPGVVTIAGWAFDESVGASTTGVSAIHVWAYPVSGGAPVMAGATAATLERSDVGAAFGGQFQRSGYRLDTVALPPGAYDLIVYAMGARGAIAERTIRVSVN